MNPGICYFYEYNNNKRLRNTGFLKTVKQYQTCLLNINIRGIPVSSGESIDLYAFFVQDFDFMSKNVGQISCGDKNISARLAIPETSLPGNKALENLDGFFLKTESGQYHAALLNNGSFDTNRIVNWQSSQAHAKRAVITEDSQGTAFESPVADEDHTMPDVLESASENKVPPMVGNRSDGETKGTQSETEKVPVFGYASHSGFKTAWAFESDPNEVTSPDSAAQAAYSQSSPGKNPVTADDFAGSMNPVSAVDSTSSAEPAAADDAAYFAKPTADDAAYFAKPAADDAAYFANPAATDAAYFAKPAAADASDSWRPVSKAADYAPAVSAKKIQRCELSVLPRRCWNLANNSFLMHGYHNYHHLLLVEDDGHFWVGVPGIYAPREARAAEYFGFPQFTRSYTDLLNLEEDERNLNEDFGYWCRFIN